MKQIAPQIWAWSRYQPQRRLDRNGHFVQRAPGEAGVLIDPVPSARATKRRSRNSAGAAAVLLTGASKAPEAADARTFRCPTSRRPAARRRRGAGTARSTPARCCRRASALSRCHHRRKAGNSPSTTARVARCSSAARSSAPRPGRSVSLPRSRRPRRPARPGACGRSWRARSRACSSARGTRSCATRSGRSRTCCTGTTPPRSSSGRRSCTGGSRSSAGSASTRSSPTAPASWA